MNATANKAGERIAEAALSFVGTPFHHQGRIPGVGLDCVGVGVCAVEAAGLHVRDFVRYGRLPEGGALERHLDALCVVVTVPQPGDIVAVRIMRRVRHLGVLVSGGRIVHAAEPRGVVLTHLDLLQGIQKFYRLRGAV